MPTRMVRQELLNSDRFLALPDDTHKLCFIYLLLAADDAGNMEGSNNRLFRLWRDCNVKTIKKVAIISEKLAEVDLIRTYENQNKVYVHIPRFNQRMRHLKRICPPPAWQENEIKQQLNNKNDGRTTGERRSNDGRTSDDRRPKRREEKRSEYIEAAKEIINYLNRKVNRNFDASNAATQQHILARLREGISIAQCKTVIDNQVSAWLDDSKMREYLTPITLFRVSKFPIYLANVPAKKELKVSL